MRKRGPGMRSASKARGKLTSRQGGGTKGRKKLPLDVVLDSEPRHLLKGYTQDQLHELFYKVHEVGSELDRILENEGDVKEILGTKIDNKTMWFYVRWDNNESSFIPAKVLNHVAPSKVISYYESILQFQNEPETNHKPTPSQPPQQQPRPEIKQTPTPKPPTLKQQLETRQNSNTNPNPPAKTFHTMNCTGCNILLQYPEGTKAIKCPVCNSIMVVPRQF